MIFRGGREAPSSPAVWPSTKHFFRPKFKVGGEGFQGSGRDGRYMPCMPTKFQACRRTLIFCQGRAGGAERPAVWPSTKHFFRPKFKVAGEGFRGLGRAGWHLPCMPTEFYAYWSTWIFLTSPGIYCSESEKLKQRGKENKYGALNVGT